MRVVLRTCRLSVFAKYLQASNLNPCVARSSPLLRCARCCLAPRRCVGPWSLVTQAILNVAMTRTKQNAQKSTGGRAKRKQLAIVAACKTIDVPAHRSNQRWVIWSVVDRWGRPVAYEYRIVWELPRNQSKRGQTTWEPHVLLICDCRELQDDLDVVDAFWDCAEQHPQPRQPLQSQTYCSDRGIALSIRAFPCGRCGFEALQAAARVLGAASWSSPAVVDAFFNWK